MMDSNRWCHGSSLIFAQADFLLLVELVANGENEPPRLSPDLRAPFRQHLGVSQRHYRETGLRHIGTFLDRILLPIGGN
jgi:hypothetical protein